MKLPGNRRGKTENKNNEKFSAKTFHYFIKTAARNTRTASGGRRFF